MAYIILDDGGPYPEEYSSNYIYFDEKNPLDMDRALKILKQQNDPRLFSNSTQTKEKIY
ncbi:hypothetical protein JW935_09000 [candidate division KSB1 bacterium]|nr:hypothetical protein [candidate division KSB1 bacterium]